MKLRTGHKVKIKSYDRIMETLRDSMGPGFSGDMNNYCGECAVIVGPYNNTSSWFYLDIDNQEWVWDKRWLEKPTSIELNDNLFEL